MQKNNRRNRYNRNTATSSRLKLSIKAGNTAEWPDQPESNPVAPRCYTPGFHNLSAILELIGYCYYYPVSPKIADVLVRQPSFWHSQPTQTYAKLDLTRYYLVSPKITCVPVREPLFSTISLNPNIRKFGLDGVLPILPDQLPKIADDARHARIVLGRLLFGWRHVRRNARRNRTQSLARLSLR